MHSKKLSLADYEKGLAAGNKVVLAQAITLAESQLAEDEAMASLLIQSMLPRRSQSIRIGITGIPGVGKSTFIDALGKQLTARGKKVAVLAVDPSSARTKGSILGDKTRMEELAKDPLAFIRPTAASQHLGGVAGKTREAILLCEAAGYEVIIVETVGVGQSETAVRDMTDFFLLLMLAGAGDELQGIKKGIMEMADAIVINKADGDNVQRVQQTRAELFQAIHYVSPTEWGWRTEILTCSALHKTGIDEIWTLIKNYQSRAEAAGFFMFNRREQHKAWMSECVDRLLRQNFLTTVQGRREELEKKVADFALFPPEAARLLIGAGIAQRG